MQQGTIKKLVLEKGFGFISGDKQEYFFHRSSVVEGSFDGLKEGQTVEYTVDADRGKGPRCSSVKPIN